MSPAPPSLRKFLRLTALIAFAVRPSYSCYLGSRQTFSGLVSTHLTSRLCVLCWAAPILARYARIAGSADPASVRGLPIPEPTLLLSGPWDGHPSPRGTSQKKTTSRNSRGGPPRSTSCPSETVGLRSARTGRVCRG